MPRESLAVVLAAGMDAVEAEVTTRVETVEVTGVEDLAVAAAAVELTQNRGRAKVRSLLRLINFWSGDMDDERNEFSFQQGRDLPYEKFSHFCFREHAYQTPFHMYST